MALTNNKACSEHCHSFEVPQGEKSGCFHIWLLLVWLIWVCLILTHSALHASALEFRLSILEGAKTEERALKAADLLLIFAFFWNKETGPYVNRGGLMAVLAYSHTTVQQQLLCLRGAWGRRQEEAKLLSFHHLCSTYKDFLEVVIIPASKLSPWFAERI